jgi:hypothetical protein
MLHQLNTATISNALQVLDESGSRSCRTPR